MESIIGHRIDYNGVGAHTQQKLTQVPPPPGYGYPFLQSVRLRLYSETPPYGHLCDIAISFNITAPFFGRLAIRPYIFL